MTLKAIICLFKKKWHWYWLFIIKLGKVKKIKNIIKPVYGRLEISNE